MLRDSENTVISSEFVRPPFILAVELLSSRVINPDYVVYVNSVFPLQMKMFDINSVREALNNCIAHQDYAKNQFITMVEHEKDRIVFVNAGTFVPESVEAVISGNRPSNYYRNKFLADAMSNLDMVDVVGSGIMRMFGSQKERGLPLPDYNLSNEEVELTLYGKVMDRQYSDMLLRMPSLTLNEAIVLDDIQKGRAPHGVFVSRLEGRRFIRKEDGEYRFTPISSMGDTDPSSIQIGKLHGKDACISKIIEYLRECGSATRTQIGAHILESYHGQCSEKQIYNKISYALKRLDEAGAVVRTGPKNRPMYSLNDINS